MKWLWKNKGLKQELPPWSGTEFKSEYRIEEGPKQIRAKRPNVILTHWSQVTKVVLSFCLVNSKTLVLRMGKEETKD